MTLTPMLTGGVSAAASTANLTRTAANALSPSIARTVSGAVSGMVKNPQYWTSFAQVVGPGYQQALADGADHAQATVYAVGNGLANAAVEIGGGIQQLPGALQGGKQVWKAVADSMLEEGREEVVQGIIERAMQNAVYNQGNPFASMEDPRAILNPRTAWEEFKGGAVVGGILGAGQTAIQSGVNAYEQAQAQRQLEQMLQTVRETQQSYNVPPDSIRDTRPQNAVQFGTGQDAEFVNNSFVWNSSTDSGTQYDMGQYVEELKTILSQINNRESFVPFEEGITGYDNVRTGLLSGLENSGLADITWQMYAGDLESPSVGYQSGLNLEDITNSQLAKTLSDEYDYQMYIRDLKRFSEEYQPSLNLEDISNNSWWTEALYNEYIRQVYAGNLENRAISYQVSSEQEDDINNTRLAEALYNEYVRQMYTNSVVDNRTTLGQEDAVNNTRFVEALHNEYVRQMYARDLEKLFMGYQPSLELENAANDTRYVEDLYKEYVRQITTVQQDQDSGADQSTDLEVAWKPGEIVQIDTIDFSDKQAVMKQLRQAQREFSALKHEMNCTVTADGKVWRITGISGMVDPWVIEKMGSSLKGSYSYHNHPAAQTWYSFSAEDVSFFFESGTAYAKASDYLYEYIMERTAETIDVSPEMVYHRFNEIYWSDVMKLAFDDIISADVDAYHETMLRISKEFHFFYERRKLSGD